MRPTKKPLTCNCKDEANRKVDNGELSQALSRGHTITGRARESMVLQALDRRSLRGRFVDGGEVRDCLSHAGWPQTTSTSSSTDHNTNMKKNRRAAE
jgi:hypothetical protein